MYSSPSAAQSMRTMYSLKSLAVLVFVAVFSTLLYVFTHEAGHALVGLTFGGKLTSFSVRFWDLSAHAGINGDFTLVQRSLISAAGVSLPLVLWLLFLVLSPKKSSPLLLWFKVFGSLGVLNTLLAWIVIPFLYIANRALGDDSTTFLHLTGIPPILVSAVSLAIYVYGWALLLSRVEGVRGLRARLKLDESFMLSQSSRRSLAAMVGIFILVTLLSLGISWFYPFESALASPEDYSPAFSLDLSRRGYASERVYSFSLDAPDEVGLFFAIKDVHSGPVQVTLSGPNGYQNTFLRGGEDFSAGQATVNPAHIPLEPGEYSVVVTFPQCEGILSGAIRLGLPAE